MPVGRYLDLLAASLLNELQVENDFRVIYLRRCLLGLEAWSEGIYWDVHAHRDWQEFQDLRAVGRFLEDSLDNIGFPQTMIGRARLDHLRSCLDSIVADGVRGDLMECGVWRGGAAIFMRGYLAAHEIGDRLVWLADSFAGLPPPSLAQDVGLDMSAAVCPMLAIPLETVQESFRRYNLLDDQVRFLPGWFEDTLPESPVEALALLRIDADLYQSTRDALRSLYPKVSPGGFVVVDDYHAIEQCRDAVDDFRREQGVDEPMEKIDWTAVYWRKSQR